MTQLFVNMVVQNTISFKTSTGKKCVKKDIVIKFEGIYLVQSTLIEAQTCLKNLEDVYDQLDLINYKQIVQKKKGSLIPIIYYEMWYLFMVEIIHIQKSLIDGENDQKIIDKINLLKKPISKPFFKFQPPQKIQLYVPPNIFKNF